MKEVYINEMGFSPNLTIKYWQDECLSDNKEIRLKTA
jgi:hypothetical protein